MPTSASLLPMALAITLVKVITLAASLCRSEAKFERVGGGENGLLNCRFYICRLHGDLLCSVSVYNTLGALLCVKKW